MKTLIRFFTSLRLAVVCLAAATVLVFIGTLAQVDLGLWDVQKKYFQSLFVFWNPNGTNLQIPVFPGGYLLGWMLVINLVASHWLRFKTTRKNLGIALTHAGVLLLLLGQFVTELVQVESAMRLEEGESSSWSESVRHTELAITETIGDEQRVVVIPDSVLARKGEVRHPDLPFRLRVREWHENSEPRLVQNARAEELPLSFAPLPVTRRMDQSNIASARIAVLDDAGVERLVDISVFLSDNQARGSLLRWANDSLGYDIGPLLQKAQRITHHGREFSISLRPTRYYKFAGAGQKPCVITLLDFRHDKYEGTATPRNFSSRIVVLNPNTGEQREALISMNTPFRFAGETFYQGSFDPRNENVTILHVVRNPVWLSPYLACVLVGIGLSIHFVMRLLNSLGRKRVPLSNEPTQIASPVATNRRGPSFQNWFPACLAGLLAIGVAAQLLSPEDKGGFREFGKIPVLLDGRVQPIDSVARNALLSISGKSKASASKRGVELEPVEWLLEAMTRSSLADTRKIFRLENLELRALLNNHAGRLGYVSLDELRPHLERIEKEAQQIQAHKEPQQRSGYERDMMHLYQSLILYQRIQTTLLPDNTSDFAVNFQTALQKFQSSLPMMLQGVRDYQTARDEKDVGLQLAADCFRQFRRMSTLSYGSYLPVTETESSERWHNVGDALLEALRTERVPTALSKFGAVLSAYQENDLASFKARAIEYREWLSAEGFRADATRTSREAWFNHASLFYKALLVYLTAMMVGCIYWVRCSEPVRRAALYILLLGLALHSAGLILRMVLHGRPPVTNLYSSAVFVGWGSVLLGAVLERIHRTGMPVVVAGLVGFITLIVAHHLASAGDTLHVLQAVLDTNLWLATHVVIITTGYAATFLAGAFATVATIRRQLDKSFSESQQHAVARIVLGVICFATLFSFVGTVLGGIWADQSWGRFWGWDPKENGALMMVIWCAVVLHARLAGLLRDRGMLIAGLIGNIITAFSWFGVNLLGVGLHTYGFMEGAFKWLIAFVAFQALVIALAYLPPLFANLRPSVPR